jgi:hypothetical protein
MESSFKNQIKRDLILALFILSLLLLIVVVVWLFNNGKLMEELKTLNFTFLGIFMPQICAITSRKRKGMWRICEFTQHIRAVITRVRHALTGLCQFSWSNRAFVLRKHMITLFILLVL